MKQLHQYCWLEDDCVVCKKSFGVSYILSKYYWHVVTANVCVLCIFSMGFGLLFRYRRYK